MKRTSSPPGPLFTADEIELMQDVTQPHKVLAKRFRKSLGKIREYRRKQLGIHLRGFNYQLEQIRDTVDWQRDDISIARELKVSPETVGQWKRQLFTKPKERDTLTKEQQREIAASQEKSAVLAAAYGVSVWTINRIRRRNKTAAGIGRPRLMLRDFPTNVNWRLPARQLAAKLGISWPTADRLRTEALMQASYAPVIPTQLVLPGILGDRALPSTVDGIDWSENTSLLAAHLKLDRHEVSQLKSTVRQHRRKTTSA